jgi:hypothetical protein
LGVSPVLTLLLACRPSVDSSLQSGRVAIGETVRAASVLGPKEPVGDVLSVGLPCGGRVAGVAVEPGWHAPGSPVVSACAGPIWVERPEPAAPGPNVLVVVLDTTRPDHLTPARTPRIVAHADGAGWRPETVIAPSPWTVPTMVSVFTGRLPWEVQTDPQWLPGPAVTLAERAQSHATWLISANAWVSPSSNLDQGFDRAAHVRTDEEAVALAQQWWAEPATAPRLLVVQLMSAHMPYSGVEPLGGAPGPNVDLAFSDLDGWPEWATPADQERIKTLYAAGVGRLDGHAGALFDLVGPDAVVAVLSDHGEELFEHGGFEHGHALWPEIVTVHAAIAGASLEPPPERVGLHQVGQALQAALGMAVVGSEPLGDQVVLGMPMAMRNPIHTWGLWAPKGRIYVGDRGSNEGRDVERQLDWALERMTPPDQPLTRWCEVQVVAGETVSLPVGAGWPAWSPPGAWGPAKRVDGVVQVEPVRSGTWWVRDPASDCERKDEPPKQPEDSMEALLQELRALGYVD